MRNDNIPLKSGIILTAAVREWYTKEELPIIMVTTQEEARDHEQAYEAGTAVFKNPLPRPRSAMP